MSTKTKQIADYLGMVLVVLAMFATATGYAELWMFQVMQWAGWVE